MSLSGIRNFQGGRSLAHQRYELIRELVYFRPLLLSRYTPFSGSAKNRQDFEFSDIRVLPCSSRIRHQEHFLSGSILYHFVQSRAKKLFKKAGAVIEITRYFVSLGSAVLCQAAKPTAVG